MRTHHAFFAAALLTLSLAASSSHAGDWPQFLGPTRNGVSTETGLVGAIGDKGPKELWRRPLGVGFSGVSVVGDRGFTMYSDGKSEYLAALDLKTGKERWRLRTGPHYVEGQGGDGPRCTPSVDAGVVYAVGATGQLVAANTEDGKALWRVDFVKTLGAEIPRWGFSSSPLIDGKKLIYNVGAKGASLVAFDKSNGKVLWKSQSDVATYASPTIARLAGERLVLFMTGTHFVGLDAESGKLRARLAFENQYKNNTPTPIAVGDDQVFIANHLKPGATLLRVSKGGGALLETQVVWQTKKMKNHMATSVVVDGHLYGFDQARLSCVDLKTGKQRWNERSGKGSLILADGKLIVLTEAGRLLLVRPSPEKYIELGRREVIEGLTWQHPVLAHGRLYLRAHKELVALDLRP